MAVQVGISKVGQYPAHVQPRGTGIGCGRPVAQQSARILAAGHAFVQNLRCGHYDIATDLPTASGSAAPSTTWQSPSDWQSIRDHVPKLAGMT